MERYRRRRIFSKIYPPIYFSAQIDIISIYKLKARAYKNGWFPSDLASWHYVIVDTDGNGITDCDDLCPRDPQKIAPGICGCNVADIDSDGDKMFDCEDMNDDNDGISDSEENGPDGNAPKYDGNFYYKYSPPLADFVEKHTSLRIIARLTLFPLVCISWAALRLGFSRAILLMLLFGLGNISFVRVSRR